MIARCKKAWAWVRRLSGDDAYDRYLRHYQERHRADAGHDCEGPLSKAEFFKQWQEHKWSGIKRCC